MIIKNLHLKQFRNHSGVNLDFDPKINLIVGQNGIGKTNILEAIHLLATTKSFRARYDRDLIPHRSEFAHIEGRIESPEDSDILEIQITKSDRSDKTSIKKAKLNKTAKSLNNFTHYLKAVLFSPEDIDIITGSPSTRRNFLNLLMFQVDADYKKNHSRYVQAVRRRNKVLELINETSSGRDQLPYWNEKVLEHGSFVQNKRQELFDAINVYFQNPENPYFTYSKDISLDYKIRRLTTLSMEEYENREIAAKSTLIGPHRDDFVVLQRNRDMAQFASRGEQRTAMFLLKLAEFHYIESKLDIRPILLLDDIFSELDAEHRENILSFINDQQTIITTASAAELPQIYISKTINLE